MLVQDFAGKMWVTGSVIGFHSAFCLLDKWCTSDRSPCTTHSPSPVPTDGFSTLGWLSQPADKQITISTLLSYMIRYLFVFEKFKILVSIFTVNNMYLARKLEKSRILFTFKMFASSHIQTEQLPFLFSVLAFFFKETTCKPQDCSCLSLLHHRSYNMNVRSWYFEARDPLAEQKKIQFGKRKSPRHMEIRR